MTALYIWNGILTFWLLIHASRGVRHEMEIQSLFLTKENKRDF